MKTQRARYIREHFGLFLCVLFITGAAIAATCALNQPWDAPITDTFRTRTVHPVSGAANRPHRGVDLSKPGSSDCGEAIQLREGCTTEKYTHSGGYGNTLVRDCGNGVKELYAHLQSYNSSSGTVQVGNTGCHLHYEVIVDGVSVDPQCVWGTGSNCPTTGNGTSGQANLCDEAQRQALKQNAQDKLNGRANSPVVNGGNTPPGNTPPPVENQEGNNTPPPPAPPEQPVQIPAAANAEGKISSCATDTWNAMINQAMLQARREDVLNKTYIVKPDSLLHYACFEQSLKYIETKAAAVFSESEHWNGLVVDISGRSAEFPKPKFITMNLTMGPQSMDMALNSSVRAIMTPYLQQNFNHTMLGGTSGISPSDTCDLMKRVWKVAQCRNFDKDATVFLKFEEMIGAADPRKFPPDMICDETGITQKMIDIAQNKDFTQISKAKSYKEYLEETSCNLTIKTGVTVHRREAQGKTSKIVKYKDGTCINPGCNYDKSEECK